MFYYIGIFFLTINDTVIIIVTTTIDIVVVVTRKTLKMNELQHTDTEEH